jgi:hypothetical protein
MPAFARDRGTGVRRAVTAPVEGHPATSAEQQRRQRAGRYGGGPVFTIPRNGRPHPTPYTWRGHHEDLPRAVWAWQTVANMQAVIRGEPPPPAVTEPWNKPACYWCGYTITCRCQAEEGT